MASPIFDEEYVDCNNCEHYHDNTCDGVTVGSERRCTAFKATRREDIPEQIKSLREDIKTLETIVMFLSVAVILTGIGDIIHYIFG